MWKSFYSTQNKTYSLHKRNNYFKLLELQWRQGATLFYLVYTQGSAICIIVTQNMVSRQSLKQTCFIFSTFQAVYK